MDDCLVTVCDQCLTASCWHGIFMCQESDTAGTVEKLASELRKLGREHPSYFSKAEIERHTGVYRVGIDGSEKPVEPESDLDAAAEELFAAWWKYREFVKRNYPDRLAGVMWVRRGDEMICHSDFEKYTQQIASLTFDLAKDSFSVIEVDGDD